MGRSAPATGATNPLGGHPAAAANLYSRSARQLRRHRLTQARRRNATAKRGPSRVKGSRR